MEHIDFLIKGRTVHQKTPSLSKLGLAGVFYEQMHPVLHVFSLSDMAGIIPEDEEEYDDCVPMKQPTNHSAPIDDDIYEELPGFWCICTLLLFIHF